MATEWWQTWEWASLVVTVLPWWCADFLGGHQGQWREGIEQDLCKAKEKKNNKSKRGAVVTTSKDACGLKNPDQIQLGILRVVQHQLLHHWSVGTCMQELYCLLPILLTLQILPTLSTLPTIPYITLQYPTIPTCTLPTIPLPIHYLHYL